MKRTIIATVATVSLLSTAVYAYGNMGSGCNMQQGHGKKMQHGSNMHHGMKKAQHQSGVRSFMKVVGQLNLSKEQYKTIRKVMHTPMPKQDSVYAAFSENGFDKDKFVQQMAQKRENMLKFKADKIEKVYNVLTAQQKKQLRVLMDLQEGKGS